MADAMMQNIRQQCLAKGISRAKAFRSLFNVLDKDHSKSLSYEEFHEGMEKEGFNQSKEELRQVFDKFDKDGSGDMDTEEFLLALWPAMSGSRQQILQRCFDTLDVVKDGVVNMEDMRVSRSKAAKKHPKFRSGEWTLPQVLQSYLDSYAFATEQGTFTMDDFSDYYQGLSATIYSDQEFEDMMKLSYGLD